MGACCCNAATGASEFALGGAQPRKWGWKKDRPDPRDKVLCFSHEVRASLPRCVDLRPKQTFPIYDQGTLGSCTANALGAAFEYEQIRQGLKSFPPSRLFIYYNERSLEGSVDEDAGAYIRDGIKVMAKYGVCDEAFWPYDERRFTEKPDERAYKEAAKTKVLEYARVPQTLEDLKACLASGFPIAFGFVVYSSFQCCWTMMTGKMSMPMCCDAPMGGHAVQACGYDDDQRVFIVRNSWGEAWGAKGHFFMPYEYILNPELAEDFWAIKCVQDASFPARSMMPEAETPGCAPLC
mmetsp:Transcript_77952/g.226158  ORF Transcript_77952/g.226158 Transcript_77952/m.226158 type:complete len:294 (-) Transcript_77952:119-1000(-)